MTAGVLQARQSVPFPLPFAELFRRQPWFAGVALCLLIMMGPTLAAMTLEQRALLGLNVWVKPLKFEFALMIYMATLAWYAGWLPARVLTSRWYRVFSRAVVAGVMAEMIWIGGAASFGVASHFNVDSPAMMAIYSVMGLVAVLLTSASLVYGIIVLRDRTSPLDPSFRLSVGVGLVATFVLTIVVAGYMSSTGGHFVGGSGSDAGGFPFFGWARDGGDLRVSHFFATHALHVIPAAGFIASRMLAASTARWTVAGASAAYVVFTGYTFVEALSGRAFLAMIH